MKKTKLYECDLEIDDKGNIVGIFENEFVRQCERSIAYDEFNKLLLSLSEAKDGYLLID